MTEYLRAFGLTLAIEIPIYVLVLPDRSRALLAGVVANLATHPAFYVLATLALRCHPAVAVLGVGETAVWLVESLILLAFFRRPVGLLVAVAALANAVSALAGVLLG